MPPAPAVLQVVRSIDARQPVYDVRTLGQLLETTISQPKLNLILLGLMGGLAVLLAALGIYGMMAYTVSQSVDEIGIRMALGARRSTVLHGVLRQALVRTTFGLVIGLGGAVAVSRAVDVWQDNAVRAQAEHLCSIDTRPQHIAANHTSPLAHRPSRSAVY